MLLRTDMVKCFVARPDNTGGGHEFLQLHRRPGDLFGNTWQPISGGIEPGESPAAAALRELREEAGLKPLEFYQLNGLCSFYIAGQDTMWHCVQYCAIIAGSSAVTLNDEHDAWRWIGRGEAMTHFMWPGDKAAIQEICQEILDGGLAKEFMRVKMA
jgi:dihydroneopterin triphosphate diphosphatase